MTPPRPEYFSERTYPQARPIMLCRQMLRHWWWNANKEEPFSSSMDCNVQIDRNAHWHFALVFFFLKKHYKPDDDND